MSHDYAKWGLLWVGASIGEVQDHGKEAALQYWQITRELTTRGIVEVMHHD